MARLKRITDTTGVVGSDWLAFDFGPDRTDPTTATHWWPYPISSGKFVRVLKVILQLPPLALTAEQAAKVVTYRQRRVLPTVGGTLKLSSAEINSIGNWSERITDANGNKGPQHSAMGTRYNENRLRVSAESKIICLEALRQAAASAGSVGALAAAIVPWLPGGAGRIGSQVAGK